VRRRAEADKVDDPMRVSFYGVRGSVPAPGPATARYGGNTSCVEVRPRDGSLIVLDAGTGIRALGAEVAESDGPTRVHLLLSHTHWDHILGLPFFAPLWQSRNELLIYPLPSDEQERFKRTIFDDIHFPVSANDIPSKVELVKPNGDVWRIGSATVRRMRLNHPGGAQGFRIDDEDGASFVYLTDNELSSPRVSMDDLSRFADGASLMVHDSQYIPSDMPAKRGWGHSVVDDVLRLGVMAEPAILGLFHHDPDRSDAELDAIGESAGRWMAQHSEATELIVAREGLVLDLVGR
jgi:phosphoribosyl 1,2-cyclic phosphodiesterase